MAIPEYYDDFDQTNSYLRMVLSLIGKHKIPPNLINLSLVYEYVVGANKALIVSFDELLSSPKKYTEKTAEELYKTYIWDEEKNTHEKLNKLLQSHFSDTLSSITKVHSNISDSNERLEKTTSNLIAEGVSGNIGTLLQSVVLESKNVLESNRIFESDLKNRNNLPLLFEEILFF